MGSSNYDVTFLYHCLNNGSDINCHYQNEQAIKTANAGISSEGIEYLCINNHWPETSFLTMPESE